MASSVGKVFLIGAGPGDPDLITIKGMECIRRADVIVYDYLAAEALLAMAGPSAECIYVGKKGSNHTLSQDKINQLLVEKAKAGHRVARLKGGDPFIFGRGGEEAEVLIAAGIPFEIVPGVTSAIAAPAYAGIPLTHREYTSTVAIVTGHEDPTKAASRINWSALAKGIGTIVFLMGVKNLPNIVENLLLHGKAPETPVALVRWGTTAKQVTVTGYLDNIVEKVRQAELKAPAIIVVGEVVQLRERLKWFENKPLMGKRIVVTRARQQASDLVTRLSELGAHCLEYPTIKVVAPNSWEALDQAISTISSYQWLIFTSVNGVNFFFSRLFELDKDTRVLGHIRTAAIGPATAARMRDFGLTADIIPKTFRAESVVEAFSNEPMNGVRILLPRAELARPVLPEELTKMGAKVDEVVAYRTVQVTDKADQLLADLQAKRIDMVTFTSSSTVTNFRSLIPADQDLEQLMAGVAVACIGPITATTARELGFQVTVESETYTIPGLCHAIEAYYTHPI